MLSPLSWMTIQVLTQQERLLQQHMRLQVLMQQQGLIQALRTQQQTTMWLGGLQAAAGAVTVQRVAILRCLQAALHSPVES
jgi:hypothetical protein